ncbi:MAG: type II secretion system F family protein [Bacilli bacterium]|nr:type II secretion system F family protein [Bacilli bacterium]
MKFILMPFIAVYHVVSAIMSAPGKLLQKAEDKAFESKDKKQKQKEEKELAALNASNSQLAQTNASVAVAQPEQSQAVAAQQEAAAGATTEGDVKLSDMASQDEAQAKKERPMKSYRYTILNSFGKKEVGTFDAEEEQDVRNYLLAQDYKILEVKERSKYDIDLNIGNKISAEDLAFSLTQLSTYIKSGIPLVDGVKILAKQTKKAVLKKSFNQLVYELLRGESFSNAMMAQGEVYPKLLINMVKTAEMTGDLPSILDDMSEYYTSMERTKKQMKSAMTYPIVVLTIAFAVLIFMLVYLVPQFSGMYADNDATMPALTLAILDISSFIQTNWLILILCAVALVVTFMYLFKHVIGFKTAVQTFLMHVPVVKDIIIYNEIANFTKTFASLINHGVFITDSMEILSKITDNEIYKKIINKTLVNLGKGDTISMAFKGEWAIPIVAYEMLVTGETTGQLGLMMEKVADHFQNLHKSVIDQMKSLLEPILICFLAVIVGIILISIIQPMFGIYQSVQ